MSLLTIKYDFTFELLKWYHQECEDYPWRNSKNPYFIWLSEVMLQQTRVSTALEYYHRWISTLPDVQSVAETPIDQILKLWEGLGYYNRARNFHMSCQIVIEQYNGNIPNDSSEFSKLPGVGPYISAAVMSIAFNAVFPAVDGNAIRVISRIYSINLPYPKSRKRIYCLLEELIDPNSPGDFNQAIMDFGRKICTPKNPSCCICTVHNYCSAYVNNNVDKYPLHIKKKPKPHYPVAVGVILKNGMILVSKRKEGGFLGGLWEFPGGKIEDGETATDCIIREVHEELGVWVKPEMFINRVKHVYSHFSISMEAYYCQFIGGVPRAIECADWRWVSLNKIENLAFPASSHKLFKNINNNLVL